jgi:hypothetical protein
MEGKHASFLENPTFPYPAGNIPSSISPLHLGHLFDLGITVNIELKIYKIL